MCPKYFYKMKYSSIESTKWSPCLNKYFVYRLRVIVTRTQYEIRSLAQRDDCAATIHYRWGSTNAFA